MMNYNYMFILKHNNKNKGFVSTTEMMFLFLKVYYYDSLFCVSYNNLYTCTWTLNVEHRLKKSNWYEKPAPQKCLFQRGGSTPSRTVDYLINDELCNELDTDPEHCFDTFQLSQMTRWIPVLFVIHLVACLKMMKIWLF